MEDVPQTEMGVCLKDSQLSSQIRCTEGSGPSRVGTVYTLETVLTTTALRGEVRHLTLKNCFLDLQTLGYFLKDQMVESRRLSQNTCQVCSFPVNSHVLISYFHVLF